MRPKVISLCDETWKIAQRIPNFSSWVRAQLILNDEASQEKIREKESSDTQEAMKFFEQFGYWPEWFQ